VTKQVCRNGLGQTSPWTGTATVAETANIPLRSLSWKCRALRRIDSSRRR